MYRMYLYVNKYETKLVHLVLMLQLDRTTAAFNKLKLIVQERV